MADTLLIRADATPAMGTGHVMRCLALATAWRRATGGRVVMLTAADVGPLAGRIAAAGVEVRTVDVPSLAPGFGSAEDAHATASVARSEAAAWLVLDGYDFGDAYQQAVADAAAPVLVLDDHGHAERYHAALVLNQNIGADARPYAASLPPERMLLGPRYALVREEFLPAPPPRPATPVAFRILVTLGGSDPDNATTTVVHALEQARIPGLEATVVAGPANQHVEPLREAVAELGNGCRLVVDSRDMPALMAAADLAVAAAGGTARELALCGVPSLVLTLAANQRPAAVAVDRLGIGVDLGWSRDATASRIARALHDLANDHPRREQMASNGRHTVDGLGADRVVAAMRRAGEAAA